MNRPIERIIDPIIYSLVDDIVPSNKDENLKKKIVKKDGIELITFKWVESDSVYWFNPSIAHFDDPELKEHLIDPDELVIKEQEIKIEFSYPLKNSVIRDYHSFGGFSRLLLGQCINEGYYTIYDEQDLEKYGVWGHARGDLVLICIEYVVEKKLCMLRIES